MILGINPLLLTAARSRVIRADIAVAWACWTANAIVQPFIDAIYKFRFGLGDQSWTQADIAALLESHVAPVARALKTVRFHYLPIIPSWPRLYLPIDKIPDGQGGHLFFDNGREVKLVRPYSYRRQGKTEGPAGYVPNGPFLLPFK